VPQHAFVLDTQLFVAGGAPGQRAATQNPGQTEQQQQREGNPAHTLHAPFLFEESQVLIDLDFADVVHAHALGSGKKCDTRAVSFTRSQGKGKG
jgi:hypothetical protein